MENNNDKISIDIEINASGQQQLNQYKAAFDGLRNSINNLSAPIAKLDTDVSTLTDSLSKLNSAGNPVGDTIDKISKASDTAKSVISGFKSALKILEIGVISLEEALTGGLTILIAFAPEIIKWVGEMIKGNTTLSALNKTLKDNKIVMDAVNQVRLQGTQNAQQELVQLKLLYAASQDHNLSLKRRKDAVNALKDQWPDTFKNVNTEIILTGKAAGAYKSLREEILATSYVEAAKNRITANNSRILENEQKTIKERANNLEILKKQGEEIKDIQGKSQDMSGGSHLAFLFNSSNTDKERTDSDKILYNIATDTKLLNKQNDELEKEIERKIQLLGTKIIAPKTTAPSIAVPKKQPKTKKAVNNNSKQVSSTDLQTMAANFAQKIELEKTNYDTEQSALDEQLKNKLIAQENYQQQSRELQSTYNENIGAKVKSFNEIDFESATKNLQNLVQQNEIEQIKITEIAKKYAQERGNFELQTTQKVSNTAFSILQNNIKSQSDAKIKQLETQKQAELNNSTLTSSQKKAIEDKYKKKEAEAKTKAFKDEQRASILQAVINGALAVTKATAQTGVLSAFVIPGIIAETAIQVATIAAQKTPQYAKGGLHYQSDGRGALLPGYSHTDNTNAYLRSGEAIVVSEAMCNPWARNLVSAINVAHGGRDFSVTNPNRGYAIGGIFTDGGNSNRYYNQPINDQKDLANTIAYQMVNNFPPVYVDVKDINNQQNILAQTINRVNL